MSIRIVITAACLTLTFLRPALAQRGLKDIPSPDPAAELAAMQVADGYEVNLFAADPMITKPLQMNFDPQGRLWVSSSSVYPQIRPGEVANDTVTVLEDRDGDGRADASTVFADGLLMPTAVLPGDGGAYVANSTEFLHLSDTDGDGKADTRRVVLSGFGTEDTHHIIHTFRWGPDARLYFNQSIYIHSHVETPRGVRRLNAGGIWRFAPESLTLDVFARGWVNTWGHAFDRWGRSLVTDGAGGATEESTQYGQEQRLKQKGQHDLWPRVAKDTQHANIFNALTDGGEHGIHQAQNPTDTHHNSDKQNGIEKLLIGLVEAGIIFSFCLRLQRGLLEIIRQVFGKFLGLNRPCGPQNNG